MPTVVLLGPQRLEPTLVTAVDERRVTGAIAAVTAGWQEREDEIDELSEHVRRPVRNLRLYARGEQVYREDPELFLAFGDGLEQVRRLQAPYRLRLAHALGAVRALMAARGEPEVIEPEVAAAIDDVRRIDAHHRGRVRAVWEEFERVHDPQRRPSVVRQKEEIAQVLAGCEALAIAGGHVSVLLDRVRLFDLGRHARETVRVVFAWSAGAMVVAEEVVLFHDSPPQGEGNAEVLGDGLGLCRGVLPFPHARRRLRLDDATRVALMARRFAPLRCVALDERTRVDWEEGEGLCRPAARALEPDGSVAMLAV
jgi:hypothetical protein